MPRKEEILKKRLFKAAVLKGGFGIMPEFLPLELTVSADALKNMSDRRRLRILLKAEKMLRSAGADRVLLTGRCKAAIKGTSAEQRFAKDRITGVPCFMLGRCFMDIYKRVDPGNRYKNRTLIIYDRELRTVSFDELARLCSLVGYITVYTDNTDGLRYTADRLFAEYGILISVKEYRLREPERSGALVIDADKGYTRVGDLRVDGAEYEIDTGGYELDNSELALFIKEEELVVKNWLSGSVVIKCYKNDS